MAINRGTVYLDAFIEYMNCFENNNDNDFVNLNRHFANYINSFYMWISFYEKNYNEIFSRLKSSFFDKNFSYRAAYNIRTYVAHNVMPITNITHDIINNTVVANIKTSDMIKFKIQNIFKKELEKKKDRLKYINVMRLSQELKVVTDEFQRTIWNELQPEITSWLEFINKIFPIDDSAIINAYIVSDNSIDSIPIGHQLKYLHDKSIRENYAFFKI